MWVAPQVREYALHYGQKQLLVGFNYLPEKWLKIRSWSVRLLVVGWITIQVEGAPAKYPSFNEVWMDNRRFFHREISLVDGPKSL